MAHRPSGKQPGLLVTPPAARAPEDSGKTQILGELQAEINPEAAPLWNFVTGHARGIALGVVALIVAILGVAGWQWRQENSEQKARAELGRIVVMQNPTARLEALEAFSGRAPKILRLQMALETAIAAVQVQNWEKAAAAYAVVAENDKKGPMGFAARLNRADLLLRQGDAMAALLEWESLADEAPQELRQPLAMQIALAAEEAGEKQRAVAAYESIVGTLPPASPDRAYFQSRIAALQ